MLIVQNSAALGSTAGGTTITSGGTLLLDGSGGPLAIGAEALTLSGTGYANLGALRNDSGNNSYAGDITLAADSRIAVAAAR